jgi:hypothetical protein
VHKCIAIAPSIALRFSALQSAVSLLCFDAPGVCCSWPLTVRRCRRLAESSKTRSEEYLEGILFGSGGASSRASQRENDADEAKVTGDCIEIGIEIALRLR